MKEWKLVEDLWDDLAASPTAVPVHDWQKEELARRKANLMNNPASGLSWDRGQEEGSQGIECHPMPNLHWAWSCCKLFRN